MRSSSARRTYLDPPRQGGPTWILLGREDLPVILLGREDLPVILLGREDLPVILLGKEDLQILLQSQCTGCHLGYVGF
jgi:hypothetical protein